MNCEIENVKAFEERSNKKDREKRIENHQIKKEQREKEVCAMERTDGETEEKEEKRET